MTDSRKNHAASPVRCGPSSVLAVSLKHIAVLTSIVIAFGLFLAPAALAQGKPCSSCGPGLHWVDNCSAGQDQIANDGALVGIDTNLDCVSDIDLIMWPCSPPNQLLYVSRSAPRDSSQNFAVGYMDGHNDVIDTELLSMCLTGSGFTLRAGAGHQHGPGVLLRSLGAIWEQPNHLDADSFFDVFFEVELPPGFPVQFLYNQTFLQLTATITCAPPNTSEYMHYQGCIPLYTSPIPGQGVHVANLVTAQHNVNPAIIPSLTEWGLIALLLVLAGVGGVFILRRRVRSES